MERVSKQAAKSAFKYAVCQLKCEKTKAHATKCIEEEGGCLPYKVFLKKIKA